MTPLLCPHRLASRSTLRDTGQVAVDNAAYAWRNADDESRCYLQLPADFVFDYRAELDETATRLDEHGNSLFGQVLIEVWAERGYVVEFIEDGNAMQHRPHDPSDATYHEVWDEAAYRLDPYAVVRAARLDDVLATYTD